ncbi:MAG: hypothetical protein CM1200mP14_22070 [Gammaproteobacteria bacterium]|nr:MAG: hypothetical protein CM1200mP14_22070 [Gammaproteobacteria bacterium]
MPAKARTSTVLVFLIGLSVVAAEAQRGLLFTVVNTPMVSKPVFSGFSLQLFSQASLGYLQAGSTFHTPYAEFSYDIYSGPRAFTGLGISALYITPAGITHGILS